MPESKAAKAEKEIRRSGPLGKLQVFLKSLGPGLITGASDDDPSGIGTYSQTGAQFGYTQLWTALFTFPLMAGIQEICARTALHTGSGLADLIRRHYPKPVLYFCVFLLFVANTVNLGADLGAMAAAGQLLFGLPFLAWLAAMTFISAVLQIFVNYRQYAKVLRFLTLSLLAYVLVVFMSPQDWGRIVRNTFIPTIQISKDYLMDLVAILGTTISPYLFFWQASQEIEEQIDEGKVTPEARKKVTKVELKWMRADVISGMLFSNLIMWFIIATTASTLFSHGITNIDSAPKAAEALKPIAGNFAYLVFASGIIGTGLLAVPVLAGSAAYAVAETFRLREGLYLKFREAPGFYGIIAFSTLIGFTIDLMHINPIKALYYTAVLNGIVAPPLLLMIMLIGNNRSIMKDRVNKRISNTLGWITTAAMTITAVALLLTLGLGH
ncbi:MAG: Nramp family divalent metal transporter [Thermodesulfovibrionales bacterium]|jgi:NRAMP (natural resistance-associated macrophage protein)-like metal ion transporter